MRPLPIKHRRVLREAGFWSNECCHPNCYSRDIALEHAFVYAGKQINELWNYVRTCRKHNVGVVGIEKDFNRWVAICQYLNFLTEKEKIENVVRYRKFDFMLEYRRLLNFEFVINKRMCWISKLGEK